MKRHCHMPSIKESLNIHFHSESCAGGVDSRHKLIQLYLRVSSATTQNSHSSE